MNPDNPCARMAVDWDIQFSPNQRMPFSKLAFRCILWKINYETDMPPDANDSFFAEIRNQSREALKARFAQLTAQAREIVSRLTAARGAITSSQ